MELDERIAALGMLTLHAATTQREIQIAGILITVAGASCNDEATNRLACLISQFVDEELITMEGM